MNRKGMFIRIAGIVAFGAAMPAALATTIHVPADFPTIQQAIVAAASGDTGLHTIDSGPPVLAVSFGDNGANQGGGIYSTGTLAAPSLNTSILRGNTAPNDPGFNPAGPIWRGIPVWRTS